MTPLSRLQLVTLRLRPQTRRLCRLSWFLPCPSARLTGSRAVARLLLVPSLRLLLLPVVIRMWRYPHRQAPLLGRLRSAQT